jgi:hypothetical protein
MQFQMTNKLNFKLFIRSLALFLTYLLAMVTLPGLSLINTANSSQKTFSLMSPLDTFNNSGLTSQYDLEFVEVGLFDNNSDLLYVWLHYKSAVSRTMFTSNSAWAMAAIWTSESRAILGGNDQDFRILPNQSQAYPLDNTSISARALVPVGGNSGNTKIDLSKCNPTTWTDVSKNVKWIGLTISRSCAGIPDKFWIAGYTSASNNADWAPDKAMYVDLNAKTSVTPSESPTPVASASPVVKRIQNFYFDQVYSRYMIDRQAYISTRSDGGFRSVRSTTPIVCQVNNTGSDLTSSSVLVTLISEGTCTLEGFAPSTALYLESAKSYMNFSVFRSEQEVDVVIPDKPRTGKTIDLEVLSFSTTDLDLTITTPKICTQPVKSNQFRIKLIKSGTCRFDLSDGGSNDYLPYEEGWEFDVLASANPKPSPSPKKTIGGSATTTKNPSGTPSNKPTTSPKIGGTANTKNP